TTKKPEMKPIPLEVEKKNIGYYEQLFASIIEEKTKSPERLQQSPSFSEHSEKVSTKTKETKYPIENTIKYQNLDSIPLQVERRHIGYYDHLPILTKSEKKETKIEEVEKKPETLEQDMEPSISSVAISEKTIELKEESIHSVVNFCCSSKCSDEILIELPAKTTQLSKIEKTIFFQFSLKIQPEMKPIPLQVEKKNIVNTTNILPEATEEPIQQFFSIYSSGRSDDEQKTKEYPEIEEASLVSHETSKQLEMKPIPLEVEKKNVGYYEQSITPERNLE
uniref:Uncharacterized protein n=1 Tax=Meloidogyne javanica TaxID=6303 RepID=A0A915MVV5_MELJA